MSDDLAQKLAGMSQQEKRELLKKLLGSEEVTSRRRHACLSSAQERIWTLSQLLPESPAYNIPLTVRLSGSLDVAALEQSLNEILCRHEILRTVFSMREGQPTQTVMPAPALQLELVDLEPMDRSEREAEALRLAAQQWGLPFDLSQAPLLRGSLLRLDETDHMLALTTHQMAFDGQSGGVLIRELAELYGAFSSGKPSPLPELPMQYADFSDWQRRWLQGQALKTQLGYWKQQLAGDIPLLQLPTDRPRSEGQTAEAAQSFALPAKLSEALRAVSRGQQASLFATLLAALQTLLYRYTGQEDILVFSSTTGRSRPELRQLIGLFANLIALRSDLSGSPTFKDLLAEVHKVVTGAYAHQDVPFEQVLETMRVERGSGAPPRFQVMFMFWYEPLPSPMLPDLRLSTINIAAQPAKFDIRLHMVDTKPELTGELRYRAGLFDRETIVRMLSHFQILLEEIAADSESRLSSLLLLSEDEQRRLLAKRTAGRELDYEAPRTPTEERVASIWADALGLERVGVHSSFFELGGDSLLATRLISRVRSELDIDLPLRSFFEVPTVSGMAERIQEACGAGQGESAPPLRAASRSGDLPVSFAQQRLWFLDQLEPGSSVYNIPTTVRLSGVLDVAALRRSFAEVVRRHESLRTTFAARGGRPVQVIAPALTVPVPVVDLSLVAATEQEAEAQRLAAEEAEWSFDLKQGPLVRVLLLRMGEDHHILHISMHHIISDAWSMGILTQELMEFYDVFAHGNRSPAPDLPVQYADFAVWQRERLQGEVLEAQLSYWKEQLRDAPKMLQLPTDRPRPPVQSFRGARKAFLISADLTRRAQALSHEEGTTLFMTLLAAFDVLLLRYTGQEDILVGSPIANRNRSEIEGLIGCFVNTLVLRTDLSGNPSFRELLGRVREMTLGAYAHQDLPFEMLVEGLRVERDLSRSPLFQVMLVLQNVPRPYSGETGLSLSVLQTQSATAKFDLFLSLTQTPQGLQGEVEYNTDLFDAATIDRLVEHFSTLLQGAVTDPGQPVRELPILTQDEQRRLLQAWNDTQTGDVRDECLHELFESQARQAPDTVAVVLEGEHLTYRELSSRSSQLAHYLRRTGVGRGSFVGLCVDRSLEMVVGVLGILKAGAAYIPLDPTYPVERLAYVLEDAARAGGATALTLLTQERFREALSGHAALICLETAWETIARASAIDPGVEVSTEEPAYAIYTSGSTGKPKGVVIPHRAVVNLLDSMRRRPGLAKQDVLMAVTTLSFDIAALELFLPLSVGGRVALVGHEVAADGAQLAARLVDSGTTAMQATPATWRLLLSSGWQGSGRLRVLCGGEALPRELADQLVEKAGAVWNMYGPTETTIWSCVGRVERGDGPVSIGRPIASTQVYILDSHLSPVPVGAVGELYLGGVGLALGYLSRPALTAERFVPNPFSTEGGGRLFRSGDVARYLRDGTIEVLGRVDHQVKVRGYRIELGEVEAVLRQHPAVQNAVVVAREDPAGGQRLMAYVTRSDGQALDVDELRRFLREKVPEYMVPSVLVTLDALPLTPNGKVDRRALPVPDGAGRDREGTFEAPRTSIEKVLAGIWAQVLGIKRVGVHDNFFDLGGHSLLLSQLHNELQKRFESEISIVQLFQYPTIHSLAGYFTQTQEEEPTLMRIEERGNRFREALRRRQPSYRHVKDRHVK